MGTDIFYLNRHSSLYSIRKSGIINTIQCSIDRNKDYFVLRARKSLEESKMGKISLYQGEEGQGINKNQIFFIIFN